MTSRKKSKPRNKSNKKREKISKENFDEIERRAALKLQVFQQKVEGGFGKVKEKMLNKKLPSWLQSVNRGLIQITDPEVYLELGAWLGFAALLHFILNKQQYNTLKDMFGHNPHDTIGMFATHPKRLGGIINEKLDEKHLNTFSITEKLDNENLFKNIYSEWLTTERGNNIYITRGQNGQDEQTKQINLHKILSNIPHRDCSWDCLPDANHQGSLYTIYALFGHNLQYLNMISLLYLKHIENAEFLYSVNLENVVMHDNKYAYERIFVKPVASKIYAIVELTAGANENEIIAELDIEDNNTREKCPVYSVYLNKTIQSSRFLIAGGKRPDLLKALWHATYLSVYYDFSFDDKKNIKFQPKLKTYWSSASGKNTAFFNYKIIAFEILFGYGYRLKKVKDNLQIGRLTGEELMSKLLISKSIYENLDEESRGFHHPPDKVSFLSIKQNPLNRIIEKKMSHFLTFLGYTPGAGETIIASADAKKVYVNLRDQTLERYVKGNVLTEDVLKVAMFLYSPFRYYSNDVITAVEFQGYPLEHEYERLYKMKNFRELLEKYIIFHSYTLVNKMKILHNKFSDIEGGLDSEDSMKYGLNQSYMKGISTRILKGQNIRNIFLLTKNTTYNFEDNIEGDDSFHDNPDDRALVSLVPQDTTTCKQKATFDTAIMAKIALFNKTDQPYSIDERFAIPREKNIAIDLKGDNFDNKHSAWYTQLYNNIDNVSLRKRGYVDEEKEGGKIVFEGGPMELD